MKPSDDDTPEPSRSPRDERPGDTAEYSGPAVPVSLGERLQTAFRLDERPRTFGDWVDAMTHVAERDGLTLDVDVLCTTDRSLHRAKFDGETHHFQCVLDAVIVPFLVDGVDTVLVRTEGPVSGDRVEIPVRRGTVETEPPGAVTSFGVATDVTGQDPDGLGPAIAYQQVCPYVKAFPTLEEYETWAGTVDAVSIPVSIEDTLEFARALGNVGNG